MRSEFCVKRVRCACLILCLLSTATFAQDSLNITKVYQESFIGRVWNSSGHDSLAFLIGEGLHIVSVRQGQESTLLSSCFPDERLTCSVSDGNILYAGTNGLMVFDISNPTAPEQIAYVGRSESYSDVATGISLYGNRLFLVYESWLTVFDVSNPAEPQEIYYTSYFNNGEEVIGRNSYAYVGGYHGFDIYNINGSVFPVGHIGTAGSTLNMAVHGNTIFLAHGYEGLTAVNVTNPSEPQIDSVLTVFGGVNSVAVLGNFLYIGTADSGIQVLNIASDEWFWVSQYAASSHIYWGDLKAFGNKLYCANGYDGLMVLDIANPAAPAFIASYSTLYCLAEITRHENNLFTHDESGEIRDYEWEAGGSLVPGNVLVDIGYFSDFFVNDNGLFALDDNVLSSYDISEPGNSTPLDTLVVAPIRHMLWLDRMSPERVLISTWLDTTTNRSQISTVNIVDPTNLYVEHSIEFDFSIYPFSSNDSMIFCGTSSDSSGEYESGYLVLGYQPEVGFTELYRSTWHESAHDLQVHNNRLYAFAYDQYPALSGYAKIYDLANGYIPVFADSLHLERMAEVIEIQPPLMIAQTYDNDVLVYDISGPNDAELVGYYELPGHPRAFEVDLERQMVLAASRGYIAVLDISAALTLADIERESPNPLVSHFGITSVFPNPFNASAQIRYTVNRTGPVTIDLYNVLGQRVENLLNDTRQPGSYILNLNGEALSTGQYFVRMSGTHTDVARITLIK